MTDSDLDAGEIEFGQSPALIVVDMSNGFTSSESPLGGDFSSQVDQARKLCVLFERIKQPVFYTTVEYDLVTQPNKARVFRQRLPDLDRLKKGTHWCNIDARLKDGLARNDNHHVIAKQWPSAFFDTQLLVYLKNYTIDSLIVCGLTTSGCVRATVIDGLQNDFPVWVVEDACGDRNQTAHHANLHDMHAKYAVVKSTKAIELMGERLTDS